MKKEEKIQSFAQQLKPFLPAESCLYVSEMIVSKVVHFTVKKGRKSKLGDYRQPWKGKPHRISVNGDLNKYAFLITTIHELAHLTTFEKFGNKVNAHGSEWKAEFVRLFEPLLKLNFLPEDVTLATQNYLKNVKASSCGDERLYRVLKRYDKNAGVLVEHLNFGDQFLLHGKTFELGKKLRKRFECKEVQTGKMYRVLGLAEIDEILTSASNKPDDL